MEISTTLGISKIADSIFKPKNIEQLKNEFQSQRGKYKNISVFSTGNNWGYGCHAPNANHDLLIDLSECNQILDFDPYHGTVTIEPGVTYGQLSRFLISKGDQWLAPVHGGGPDCSVLGNALERGYGITPITDHFSSILSLSAILNNGELYEGSLKKLGFEKLDKLFKYGIGPYYDGIFSQSGLGIVTEITIKLAPKAAYVEMFYVNIVHEKDLEIAVESIKNIKRILGSAVGGINLINKERCLSMAIDYPINKIKSDEALSPEEIHMYSKKLKLTPWLIVGMIYGEKTIVKSTKSIIKDEFKKFKNRSVYINSNNIKAICFLNKTFKLLSLNSFSKITESLLSLYDILNGRPNNLALKLAYWKNENSELKNQKVLNPNKDNCGLIWYTPLIELKGSSVFTFVQFIKSAAQKFNTNPLITITTIDDLCFDSTIPILFNKKNIADQKNARAYYEYLLTEGSKLGFFPYRLNIETQSKFNIKTLDLGIKPINEARYK